MNTRIVLIGTGLVLGVSAAWAVVRRDDGFPHDRHARVFPLCVGCHAGIQSGSQAEWYPEPSSCENCHDGATESRIEWTGPGRDPSNLRFDHPTHTTAVQQAADSVSCQSCHQEVGRTERMAVGRARPETCIACHAHQAPEHLASSANCQECHVRITAATALAVERIGNFPKPTTHEDDSFLAGHGRDLRADDQTCAVCHARESCERCHLNGNSVAPIASLATDARFAALAEGREATYTVPASHERRDWLWRHATDATEGAASCANCHAQPSCQACHQGAALDEIAALPQPMPGGAQGVVFTDDEAPVVHPVGFSLTHGSQAAASGENCLSCHTEQSFCLDCHEGPSSPSFHVGNFRERHSALAYGGEAECSSCHNPEVFCRGCHAGNGLASAGRLNVAFHTAQPFWLLGHGQAARRELQSCRTCHAQTDCAQCHSAVGAWRVNPHGPGFDPNVQHANRLTCLRCHRNDQINPQ